jgi:hypothetical protein
LKRKEVIEIAGEFLLFNFLLFKPLKRKEVIEIAGEFLLLISSPL